MGITLTDRMWYSFRK